MPKTDYFGSIFPKSPNAEGGGLLPDSAGLNPALGLIKRNSTIVLRVHQNNNSLLAC